MRISKIFSSLLLTLLSTLALAGPDSKFYFTNNTANPIKIHTETQFDVPLDETKYWTAYEGTVAPYQKVMLLSVSRNTGIKNGKTFRFSTQITDPKQVENEVRYDIVVTGTAVGSNIKHIRSINGQGKQQILDGYGLDMATGQFADYPINLYSYAWLPTGDFYESASFVLDSPRQKLAKAVDSQSIKVLSYNVQLMPFYTGTVNKLNNPSIRAEHIANLIDNDYDVVVIQELFDRDLRNTFISSLSQIYPYHTDVLNADTKRFLTGGVVVFSMWPIESQQSFLYDNCTGMDCNAAKGFLETRINKQGQNIYVYATHTQADDPSTVEKQLKQLKRHIDSQSEILAGNPAFVVGDLNLNMFNENDLAKITNTFNTNINDNQGYPFSLDPTINTMSTSKKQERLDYIIPLNTFKSTQSGLTNIFLVRDFKTEKMWPDFDTSDHFPIEGLFKYESL